MLFEKPLKAVCNVKVQGCHNIPCNSCFLKFKEHRCVPLDADAHAIFDRIMRTKHEGHIDKFLQQRGWFLEDLEEALARISKPHLTQTHAYTSPTAESTAWSENLPVFVSLASPPDNATVESSGTTHLPTVDSVTSSYDDDKHIARSPGTHIYPVPATYVNETVRSEGSSNSGDPYNSKYHARPGKFHKESAPYYEKWVTYERVERSVVSRSSPRRKEIKRAVYDLLDGLRNRRSYY
ncbi:hypothetical protein D6C99_07337 [Aureobasidium pullulans]|uniref:Uncharacterized protein n=1 Tax=Aureobasidium pullulans TaxID=5580 RepID=A0A4S9MI40_AURPU|nr:hypothetical protein D6D12_07598 [Aureobasidium pullulans]THX38629.1 hypothetical protein D6D11_09011 [Aureobasidium pullulans]THY42741.1 hypothetical protein D6C99_07337 [Aureobasidium pullulans]